MSNLKKTFNTLLYFIDIIWRHSKSYYLMCFFYIVLNALQPFVTIFVTRNVVKELSESKDISYLMVQVLIGIGLYFFITVGSSILDYGMNLKIYMLDDFFREQMGKKAMTMDFSYTENVKVLEQSERATTGMSFYSGGIKGIMTDIIAIISYFVIFVGSMYIITKMHLWILVVLILSIFLNCFVQFRIKEMDRNFWNSAVGINRTYTYFCDMAKDFKCGKDIRLNNSKELIFYELDKFTEEFDEFSAGHFKRLSYWGILEVFFVVIQLVVIYVFIASETVKGRYSVAEFSLYIAAATLFTSNLKKIIEQILELRKKASFMGEYVQFMNIKNEMIRDTDLAPDMSRFDMEFIHVSFNYPGRQEKILDDISFKISKGEKISIVGMNGAGKTTLIKLMIRLYDPTEGVILLNGINIKNYNYDKYLECFSVVFQDFSLFASSVKENVVIDRFYEQENFEAAVKKAGIHGVIEKLKYKMDTSVFKIFDEEGVEFSGGESQKLAIARAYYKDAPIIVLDEPTSALDPYAEEEIYSKFNDLVQDKTAIYISHRMSSCKFCQRIMVIHNGKIVEQGSHSQLIENQGGIYSRLYGAQAEYYT